MEMEESYVFFGEYEIVMKDDGAVILGHLQELYRWYSREDSTRRKTVQPKQLKWRYFHMQ